MLFLPFGASIVALAPAEDVNYPRFLAQQPRAGEEALLGSEISVKEENKAVNPRLLALENVAAAAEVAIEGRRLALGFDNEIIPQAGGSQDDELQIIAENVAGFNGGDAVPPPVPPPPPPPHPLTVGGERNREPRREMDRGALCIHRGGHGESERDSHQVCPAFDMGITPSPAVSNEQDAVRPTGARPKTPKKLTDKEKEKMARKAKKKEGGQTGHDGTAQVTCCSPFGRSQQRHAYGGGGISPSLSRSSEQMALPPWNFPKSSNWWKNEATKTKFRDIILKSITEEKELNGNILCYEKPSVGERRFRKPRGSLYRFVCPSSISYVMRFKIKTSRPSEYRVTFINNDNEVGALWGQVWSYGLEISAVNVSKDYRNKGLGTVMVAAAMQVWILKGRCKPAIIICNRSMLSSLSFYHFLLHLEKLESISKIVDKEFPLCVRNFGIKLSESDFGDMRGESNWKGWDREAVHSYMAGTIAYLRAGTLAGYTRCSVRNLEGTIEDILLTIDEYMQECEDEKGEAVPQCIVKFNSIFMNADIIFMAPNSFDEL